MVFVSLVVRLLVQVVMKMEGESLVGAWIAAVRLKIVRYTTILQLNLVGESVSSFLTDYKWKIAVFGEIPRTGEAAWLY